MKCHFCDKDATVHFKQVVNGGMKEVHLCEKCASEKGITDLASFSFDNLFDDESIVVGQDDSNMLGFLEPDYLLDVCDSCGFTLESFKKIGRMGCPKCFNTFRDNVDSLLDSMHRGSTHTGKAPDKMFEILELENQLELAQIELTNAVEGEDFENAAVLRDRIRELTDKQQIHTANEV